MSGWARCERGKAIQRGDRRDQDGKKKEKAVGALRQQHG
jgi:hypothetical protein